MKRQGKGQDTDTASPPVDAGTAKPRVVLVTSPPPPLDAVDMRLRFRAPHLSLPLTRSPSPPPVPFLNGPPVRFYLGRNGADSAMLATQGKASMSYMAARVGWALLSRLRLGWWFRGKTRDRLYVVPL